MRGSRKRGRERKGEKERDRGRKTGRGRERGREMEGGGEGGEKGRETQVWRALALPRTGLLGPRKSLARAPGLWGGTCIGFMSPEELTCLSPPRLTLRLTPLPSHSAVSTWSQLGINLISEWSVQTKSKLPFPVRMKAALSPTGLSRHIGFNF